MTSSPPEVACHAVSVEFDGRPVLSDISLTIEPGTFLAVLGPNGAGKSTLIRTLLGLQPADHGTVTIGGVDVSDFKDRHLLALVPQRLPQAGAVPVSVAELVSSGRVGRRPRAPWLSGADRESVAAALAAVDLADRRHDRVDTLSGGQQRRVLIARSLAAGARVLVLDEPTAGVDARSQELLAKVLGEQRAHRTVILVTHELGPLAPLVTRTLVLVDGHVVYDGPTPPAQFLHDHVHHHADDEAPGPILDT